ncbi:MAG TPA: chromosome partitioning protein [Flavobacteriales bacterium]|nr:chromosome partitioning protein [Flavobacteriales bacterium]HRE74965.1 Mrp/NBP35 family ATP-binding protein [Flavobacteriales bacterium]HRJ38077.1 Mrp/NBP35 family ATP-binding protein [Flavobacteriales bacterium]
MIEKIKEALSNVIEPDLKKDLIALDLVSDIKADNNEISFTVRINNPALHSRKRMEEACRFAIERFLGNTYKVSVNVVALGADRSPDQRSILPGVKNIVAIASGKGGVGKSTITANLAAGLAKKGYKVGLIDADIYGPSMPIMFDVQHEKPVALEIDGRSMIKPVESYGVKLLSIGFFAELDQAIVWRGAMASKALTQMFRDTHWGELDYMLIDLPPGTGDIHLSLVQLVPLTGAVVVSTPQQIALADAKKGVSMFQLDSIKVPVLGMIENMAYFTPAELPENKYYIFGQGGARQLAEQIDVPFLGEVPLVQSIRESGDAGRPAVLQEGTPTAIAFDLIVANFVERVNWRNTHMAPTKPVEMQG